MVNAFILRSAAKHYNIPYSSLYNGIKNHGGVSFQGFSGCTSNILTHDEEQKIVEHVKWKAQIGYGVTWEMVGLNDILLEILMSGFQLQLLIQEILVGVTKANPGRKTGWEEVSHKPDRSWVRRFAARHNLVLRFYMIRDQI